MTHREIEALLRADPTAIQLLEAVERVGPKGAYIGAGFLRNRVWDSFYSDLSKYPEADIDVIYYDKNNIEPAYDYEFERALSEYMPTNDWQVRNQARMHDFGGHDPFTSLVDGLRHWAETATTVSVRLNCNVMEFIAPFGFDDLMNHILRRTPSMKQNDPEGFSVRLEAKGWQQRWPNLKVIR